MNQTIIKVILFFIMCSMAFAQSSTEQGTEIPFDGSSMAASIAAKQKLYDDAVEAFKTQKAGQLVKLLHGALDVKITDTTFDHEQAGDKIPFSVTVLVSINEERYAAAMTELEKELTVLGAKRTDYENYRSLSIIQPNNEVVNGPLLKVYYEFSEASYQIVDVYLCKPLAREEINIEIAFLGTDGGKFFSTKKLEFQADRGCYIGYFGRENIVFTGTVPVQVLENTTSIAAKIDLTKLDYLITSHENE